MSGPNDDVGHVLRQLDAAVGRSNYGFLVAEPQVPGWFVASDPTERAQLAGPAGQSADRAEYRAQRQEPEELAGAPAAAVARSGKGRLRKRLARSQG